jgi:hypothetical protein
MMSTERRQVLDMLAEGKITAEDAENLLGKLNGAEPTTGGVPESARGDGARDGSPRFLRVVVDSSDGDQVNVRVPLALVRTGIKLSTMLPSHANESLEEHGIDLSKMSGLEGEELVEALKELTVDVDSADGDKVRVFCE